MNEAILPLAKAVNGFKAVSLFSNCGAGDVGYRQAGFEFQVMAELDPRRLEVCLLNHPGATGVKGDLRETWNEVIEKYRSRAGDEQPALLAACPPCQGMSSARGIRGLNEDADAGSKDERNLLAVVIAKVALALRPKLIVVENVAEFLTKLVRHPETKQPVTASKLLTSMIQADYQVFPIVTDLADFGVPQRRVRCFLTFVRKDVGALKELVDKKLAPYPYPEYSDVNGVARISLANVLKGFNLPSLDASSKELAYSEVGEGMHCVPVWPEERYKMVAAIPPNSGASAWENDTCSMCGKVEVTPNDALCPICQKPLLRPVIKGEDGEYRLISGFKTSSYKRMRPDSPSSTILTASGHVGSHCTIHPYENRLLSILECAYIQTFPKTFQWGDALKKWGHSNVRAMIGEAVPPLFTELHGKVLIDVLSGRLENKMISLNDRRCRTANKRLVVQHSEEIRFEQKV